MSGVRVARQAGIDQCSTHDRSHPVDQRVVYAASRDVNDAVSPRFKEAYFGRTDSSADGQASAQPKPFSRSRFNLNCGQSMRTRQLIERGASVRGDSMLTKTR